MTMFKTDTSQIVWALYPLVQLYKPFQRKRPTWQLQKKFNPSLPASITDSNSFKTSIQSSKAFSMQIFFFSLISTVYTTIYFALFIQNQFSFRLYFKCPVKYSFRNSISNLQSFSCQQNKLNSLYFCHLLACYTVNQGYFKFHLSGTRFI